MLSITSLTEMTEFKHLPAKLIPFSPTSHSHQTGSTGWHWTGKAMYVMSGGGLATGWVKCNVVGYILVLGRI